jgi:hypothetical protein
MGIYDLLDRKNEGVPRTQWGQEYLNDHSTNDRSTHPYSYSPFFHWKSPDWQKTDLANYDDRMRQWKYDDWNAVCVRYGRRFESITPDNLSNMLSEFFGEQVVCTALVVGCNVSNGHPYFIFYHRKVNPA